MIHAERRDMGTFSVIIQERGGGGERDAAFFAVYRLVQSDARFGTLTARRTGRNSPAERADPEPAAPSLHLTAARFLANSARAGAVPPAPGGRNTKGSMRCPSSALELLSNRTE